MSKLFVLSMLIFVFSASVYAQTKNYTEGVSSFQRKNYQASANYLYLSLSETVGAENEAAQYLLGLSLYKLGLYQASTFPFTKLIKSGSKEIKQKTLVKLAAISNKIGNENMLDFAIADLKPTDLEKMAQDLYFYKLGTATFEKKLYDKSVEYLKKSLEIKYNSAAASRLGLAYLRLGKMDAAIQVFDDLVAKLKSIRSNQSQIDYARVNLARAFYQAKKFNQAVEQYLLVSVESPTYFASRMELAWSFYNLNKPNEALAALQSIHTPFFVNEFAPEPLYLRAIILNSICQLDEASAVVKNFESSYKLMGQLLANWNANPPKNEIYLDELNFALETIKRIKQSPKDRVVILNKYNGKIPFRITYSVIKDPRFKKNYDALLQVNAENEIVRKNFNVASEKLRAYLDQIYSERIRFFEDETAGSFKKLSRLFEKEIQYFLDQMALVRYELTETKKLQIKNAARNGNEKLEKEKPLEKSRFAYASESKKYWPFRKEVWRDEIGSFEYYGENLCVKE